ncbi:DUF3265 domain-containing protein [Vibrio atlanticus]|nr:DUF3265 domain-containing protein [Vibrio atlanticus]
MLKRDSQRVAFLSCVEFVVYGSVGIALLTP